jgi:hypothetical protein
VPDNIIEKNLKINHLLTYVRLHSRFDTIFNKLRFEICPLNKYKHRIGTHDNVREIYKKKEKEKRSTCGQYMEYGTQMFIFITSFTVATMTWLTVMEYLYHKRPRICFIFGKHFQVLSSFMTYHRVCN